MIFAHTKYGFILHPFIFFKYFQVIIYMNQPLLNQNVAPPIKKKHLISPIERYNYFIDIYNLPSNLVDNMPLNKMNQHKVYTTIYEILNRTFLKIVMILLLFILPFINMILLFIIWYCLIVYLLELKTFNKNKEKVPEPFKNMVYDPQICNTLRKDHYFFQVELKQLEGFTFNYNEEMKKELNLRKERGKVKFMVYNPQFWCHYHKYPTYKKYHYVLTGTSTVIVIISMIFWSFFLF